jgi:hypothetical protein
MYWKLLEFTKNSFTISTVNTQKSAVHAPDGIALNGYDAVTNPCFYLQPSVTFTSQIPPQVTRVQFFENAVNTTNYGLEIVVDYATKWRIGKHLTYFGKTSLLEGSIRWCRAMRMRTSWRR